MRLVLIGPPGAGKGTQSQRLIDALRITHLSTGDLLRQAGQAGSPLWEKVRVFMETGMLVPDAIITQIVIDCLQEPQFEAGVLLDGFPRTISQAESLDQFLISRGTPLDVAVEIRVDEFLLLQRLVGRKRVDDKLDVFRHRLVSYREQTEPLLEYYQRQGLLQSIDGIGTTDEVFDRLKFALGRLHRGPHSAKNKDQLAGDAEVPG